MHETYYHQIKNKNRFRRGRKILWWTFSLLFLTAFAYASLLAFKFYSIGKKISGETIKYSFIKTVHNIASKDSVKLKSTEDNRINILLLGIAGGNQSGKNLTDTIMIASLDQKNGRVALFSIPRDLYVKIPGTDKYMKMNSVYQYDIANNRENVESKDINLLKKTIEEITSLKINYYAVVNFDGFRKIIDGIGGINIINERDIFDPRYPGPNHSYETFELSKGFHNLDGETALKYARERHADPEGDFGRAKRQQQVLQAIKNKIFSAGIYFNVFALNNIFNAIGNNISTDIKLEEIGEFIRLSKKLDTQNIVNVVADAWNKDSLLKVSHIFHDDTRFFILVPRIGNWSEMQDLAQNIFELDGIKKRMEEIKKEQPLILILNRSGDKNLSDKIRSLIKEKLGISNISVVIEKETFISKETIVIDKCDGKKLFTMDELLKKTGGRLDKDGLHIVNLQAEADFLIVLGQDIIEAHSFEEDSIEEYNKTQEMEF